MKIKFTHSLITAIAIVTSTAPAYANPTEWINPEVLRENPQAYCNDVIGQNVQNDVDSYDQNDIQSGSSSSSQSHNEYHSRTRKRGGNGGFGFGGFNIKAGGKGSRSSVDKINRSSSNSSESFRDKSYKEFRDRSSVTSVAVGKNCSSFVEGAAAIQINETNSRIERLRMRYQQW